MTNETDLPPARSRTTFSVCLDGPQLQQESKRKPRFAIFVATAAGLGYLPKAPGTWGSIAGAAIYVALFLVIPCEVTIRGTVLATSLISCEGSPGFGRSAWLITSGLNEALAGLNYCGDRS